MISASTAALAKAQRFFDAVLIHGVHDEFAVFERDGIVGDVDALFGVENLADVGQYAHVFGLPSVPDLSCGTVEKIVSLNKAYLRGVKPPLRNSKFVHG